MNINRHNYEEFFLLYIDNELNQEECLKVDAFIQENPDLAADLDILKETTLSADAVLFENKELLLRKEEGISIANYQEYFLLDVDKELNKEQEDEVEKFVLQHPELQNEFTLLHKTKLEPVEVVFKNKEVLYRKDKVVRIIPVAWMRMSAAAAVFAIIAFGWLMLNHEEVVSPEQTVAIVEQPKPQQKNPEVAAGKPVEIKQDVVKEEQNTGKLQSLAAIKSSKVYNKVEKTKVLIIKQQEDVAMQQVKERRIKDPESLIVPGNVPPEEIITQSPTVAISKPKKKIVIEGEESQIATLAVNNAKTEANSIVSQAVYKQVDTNEEERNIYIGSAAINKNKIKALFKKASGLFKNNGDDEKGLQIAAFRLKGK